MTIPPPQRRLRQLPRLLGDRLPARLLAQLRELIFQYLMLLLLQPPLLQRCVAVGAGVEAHHLWRYPLLRLRHQYGGPKGVASEGLGMRHLDAACSSSVGYLPSGSKRKNAVPAPLRQCVPFSARVLYILTDIVF